jgi:DNA-binding HxlR family transcriptional regulator
MVYIEDSEIKKPDLLRSLQTFSNLDRLEIFKIINNLGGKIQFKQILSRKYQGSTGKSSRLSSHLNKLRNNGIINKDSTGYYITPLGRDLAVQILNMEKLFTRFNNELMVRTSDFSLEPFNEKKITEFLIREADLEKIDAQKIAIKAKKRLMNVKIEYLTAPLIREFINSILLEMGYEEARHKLTRLGVPPFDITELLRNVRFNNADDLFAELGKNVFEQFLLLNLLPRGSADFYLSGRLFFLNPETWALCPLELVLPGEILFNFLKTELDLLPVSKMEKVKNFTAILKGIIEKLKEIFIGGLLISDFQLLVIKISEYLEKSIEGIVELLFSCFPDAEFNKTLGPRCLHDCAWELRIELTNIESTDGFNVFNNIIDIYHSEYLLLKEFNDKNQPNQADIKNIDIISRKPTLLINLNQNLQHSIQFSSDLESIEPYLKKLLETALLHKIIFIKQTQLPRNENITKTLLTPKLTPIRTVFNKKNAQIAITTPQIVIDKIFINLPRIVQITEKISEHIEESNKTIKNRSEGRDQDKFFIELKKWVYNSMNLFDQKFNLLSKNLTKFKNWEEISDRLFDEKFLNRKIDLHEYSGNLKLICSIAINGIVETTRYFTGLYPDQNESSMDFALKILSFISDLLKNNSRNKSVEYVLSQPHLDNYLQVRFILDAILLQKMSAEFLSVKGEEKLISFETLQKLKYTGEKNPKHYNLTNYIDKQVKERFSSDTFPYSWSFFRTDLPININKRIKDFLLLQGKDVDGALLDLFIDENASNELSQKLMEVYRLMIENGINSFSFSKILGSQKDTQYYKQGGSYRLVSYFKKFIQNLVLNRKDSIL